MGTTLGGCLLLLAGLLLGYRELFMLGAAGLTAVAVGTVWGLVPPALHVDRVVVPGRVRRGEPADSVVDVMARGRAGRLLSLHDGVWDADGKPASEAVTTEVFARPGLPTRVRLRLPTNQRGVFQVGPLRIGRTDPLGLWSALRPVGTAQQLVVWPTWHAVPASAIGRTAQIEATRDPQHTESTTFHTLREYVSGDDLRHIHWRTSARMGTLMIRRHEGASIARLVLLIDDRAPSYVDADSFEQAVEVAASVLVSLTDAGRRLAVMSASDPTRDPVTTTAAGLDLLAAARLTSSGVSDQRIQAQLRLRPLGDALLVVTGTVGDVTLAAPLAAKYHSVQTLELGPETRLDVAGAVIAAPTAAGMIARLREQR
ncbi:hypothetical protein GCM10027280_22740 [Micromonospora polyrhachis]|uniref:Uncharacterized protein (DUF58 family) n=1 Tax=Micromonospora polyrhachis TaxID=1282883 RepID=A0A7W7SYD1_9ACTN|nr:DUF58 domain-containing protein [Micromonospora polyrhachis]MBB4962592.1 uncharacterized protein (DUF58 family) [Micromonospora polyrhachis]